jgi:hypothetical protein
MARYSRVVFGLIVLAAGGSAAPSLRRDVLAFKRHRDPRVIAARLRGGISPRHPRAQSEKSLEVRCSAALWQGGSQLARTIKLEEPPEHTVTAAERDSAALTSTGADADEGATAGSASVPDSESHYNADAGSAAADGNGESSESTSAASTEAVAELTLLTPGETAVIASALQPAEASEETYMTELRALALDLLNEASTLSTERSIAADSTALTENSAATDSGSTASTTTAVSSSSKVWRWKLATCAARLLRWSAKHCTRQLKDLSSSATPTLNFHLSYKLSAAVSCSVHALRVLTALCLRIHIACSPSVYVHTHCSCLCCYRSKML